MTANGISQKFTIETTGSEAHVRGALCQVLEGLLRRGVCKDVCGNAEIVLAEALNNIAEHAYATQQPGPVEIDVEIEDASLRFVIKDWGTHLPGHKVPDPVLPDSNVPLEELPEGGFGWFLLHSLTESLSYSRERDENCLMLLVPQRPDNA